MKQAYIYLNYNYKSLVVIQSYLDVLKQSLMELGFHCEYIRNLTGVDKNDLIVFPLGLDAYKYYHKGYHNYILWIQGVTSEESYLKHKSNIRRFVLNYVDIFAMKRAKAILYVSDALRAYYEKVGHCSFQNKSYTMPCFNESLSDIDLSIKDYNKFRFAYVGSLSVWQCFDETLEIYKKIEDLVPETSLKILSFQEKEALERVRIFKIRNYEIKSVPQEYVREELKDISYGFVIRENNIVNTVATPTKLSSYLAAGVLPIYSISLRDFYRATKDMNIALPLYKNETNSAAKTIIDYINNPKDKNKIKEDIIKLFSTYYSKDYHKKKISDFLGPIL